jgi:hypothetical protein
MESEERGDSSLSNHFAGPGSPRALEKGRIGAGACQRTGTSRSACLKVPLSSAAVDNTPQARHQQDRRTLANDRRVWRPVPVGGMNVVKLWREILIWPLHGERMQRGGPFLCIDTNSHIHRQANSRHTKVKRSMSSFMALAS